ncbi:MAG: Hsp20/alpha crystallin family protein [Pseudomonadota bacterium]
MSLVPRNSLFDVDRFFNDFWAPAARDTQAGTFFAPRVDIKDRDGDYEITAELPGVDRDDIHVHVKEGILTLEAESRQEDSEEQDGKLIRQERRYGKFMRSFNLGSDVHEEDIKASFKDGVLRLAAPKLVEQPPERRRIEVS